MSRVHKGKLQNLLISWHNGAVATTKWLEEIGISSNLVGAYKRNGWVVSFARRAYARPQDQIKWYGALHALQSQLKLDVHVGAKTALELQGVSHFIPMGQQTIDILKVPKTRIPRWFFLHKWEERIRVPECNFLPPQVEVQEHSMGNLSIQISSRERAALELLYLAPRLYDFEEVRLIMDSLGSLRANVLSELLLVCTSEKVKRLILYFGDQQKHPWRQHLDEEKIKLSPSLLKIVPKNGRYHAKYNLFLPHEYVIQNDQEIKF